MMAKRIEEIQNSGIYYEDDQIKAERAYKSLAKKIKDEGIPLTDKYGDDT